MGRMIARALREDAGQDLLEYAMLSAFISLIAIAALLTAWTLHRGLFVFNPYPKFARPPFDPVPATALALLAAPVLAGVRKAEERAP